MSAVIERPQQEIVQTLGAASLLQAITQAAANPAVDIEKMERLFAMHQQIVAKEAEAAFNDAMAQAQASILPVATTILNDHTKSRYAELADLNRQIVPIYTAQGLSLSFDTADSPIKDFLRIVGTLSHAKGHSRQYHIDLPPDDVGAKGNVNKTGVQATGSTNTYGRRYLTMMIFNVSTYDETDGNSKTVNNPASSKSVAANCWDDLDELQKKEVQKIADKVISLHEDKGAAASFDLWNKETANLEPELSAAALGQLPRGMKTLWNALAKARKEQNTFVG